MIYIVKDYDTVTYAGTNFKEATSHTKGSDHISVWKDGKWIGDKTYNGKWSFKTKWHKDNQ